MMFKRILRGGAALLPIAAVALPLAVSQPALAAAETIRPTTTLDLVSPAADCSPGHVLPCSLREAVLRADNLSNPVIQLAAATYVLNRQRTTQDDGKTGDLEVTNSMTIQGAGAGQTIIRANNDPGIGAVALPINDDRVIEVDGSEVPPSLVLADLTVTGGVAPHSNQQGIEPNGGGILNDSGIITVRNVMVDKNQTVPGQFGNGGGLANLGKATVLNSTFSNNVAEQDGGGIWNSHAAVTPDTFANLFLTKNTAKGIALAEAGGGGIYNELRSGVARFTDIMVVGNNATRMNGGGVYEGSDTTATVTYDRMTLASNMANLQGGGFYTGFSHTLVTNSTITDNSIRLDDQNGITDGGGVAVGFAGGIVTLNNDTVTRNSAPAATGGGLYVGSRESIKLHNTLVVNNLGRGGTVSNCHKDGTGLTKGIISASAGNGNIVNDLTCGLGGTNREGVGAAFDPNLGVLADNGGPRDGAPTADSATLTRALPSGSIAINTADNANCPATDERGISRPQQAICDVGAYEFVLAVVASPTPKLPAAGQVGAAPDYSLGLLAVLLFGLAGIPVALRGRRR